MGIRSVYVCAGLVGAVAALRVGVNPGGSFEGQVSKEQGSCATTVTGDVSWEQQSSSCCVTITGEMDGLCLKRSESTLDLSGLGVALDADTVASSRPTPIADFTARHFESASHAPNVDSTARYFEAALFIPTHCGILRDAFPAEAAGQRTPVGSSNSVTWPEIGGGTHENTSFEGGDDVVPSSPTGDVADNTSLGKDFHDVLNVAMLQHLRSLRAKQSSTGRGISKQSAPTGHVRRHQPDRLQRGLHAQRALAQLGRPRPLRRW